MDTDGLSGCRFRTQNINTQCFMHYDTQHVSTFDVFLWQSVLQSKWDMAKEIQKKKFS